MATKYISVINLNNEDLKIKDSEARSSIESLNIGSLQNDVNGLKTDVSSLKTDNTTNKSNIKSLQNDNTTNKSNITSLQNDNTTNKANIASLKSKVINFAYDQTTEKITITKGE